MPDGQHSRLLAAPVGRTKRNNTMKRKLLAIVIGGLLALGLIGGAAAEQAPGQLGYEGQPGNQGNGLLGYEGQPGNQGG
jgi:hypothetical protein